MKSLQSILPERLRGKIFTHPSEVSSQDLRDFAEASIKYVDANVDTLRGNVAGPEITISVVTK